MMLYIFNNNRLFNLKFTTNYLIIKKCLKNVLEKVLLLTNTLLLDRIDL